MFFMQEVLTALCASSPAFSVLAPRGTQDWSMWLWSCIVGQCSWEEEESLKPSDDLEGAGALNEFIHS